MKHGYKRFLQTGQRREPNTAKLKMDSYALFKDTLVVFESTQNWWVMCLFLAIGKRYIFHRGLSWNSQSILGNGLFPGRKEKDKDRQAVFPTLTNPFFWKWPAGRRTSWWKHSSIEGTSRNSLETLPKCRMLGTIIKSAGSRIGILADEVICNHDYDTSRLHCPCDFSRRRSNTFRTTWKLQSQHLK